MVEGPLTSRTILISGTHLWNPGDDFVRNGVVRILREALPEYHLNLLFYDFNPEEIRPPQAPRSDNRVAPRDLAALAPAIDAVVIAGLSAGAEVEPLYHGILAAGLEDRVFLIGAGYENDYAAAWIEREPIATLFRQARIVTGRTARHPAWMDRNGAPYRHLNCPAILSVPAVRSVPPGQRIRRALFSIQLPHEGGTPNQSTGRAMFELAAQALGELRSHCEVALLAHHKSEFQHFATVGLPGSIPVLFSSFEEDLASIYPRFDLVISTRLHSALYANGHGLPAIVLNDTDRHTHCLEGFPHVTWVRDLPALRDHFAGLAALDLAQVALDLQAFKAGLLEAYVDCLRAPLLEVLRTPKRLAPLRLDDPSFDSELKEQKLLRRLVGPGMTVLDVGAHQGKYTRLLSSLVGPGGRVVAFEPTPASAQVLEARLRVAGAGNVELHREAIFSEPGTVELHEFPRTYSSWNSLGVPAMPDPEHPERLVPLAAVRQVPANSLDVFCEAAGIHQVDYLKLDVEGAERDALRGARGLLERRAIRFLQFEISRKPLEGMGRTAREVFELLAGHGYEVHAITEAGEIGPPATDSEAFFDNYIAFPAAPGEARMPLHVFTIVLNGMPFLRYHIEMLKRLPIPWHWHVIEGVAALKHDTAWSVSRGGYISDEVHIQGRSVDGTSEYLDELAREHPGRISIYRKPRGEFWDGKLEMVNAPLAAVPDGALLWQIDADELWTVEQAVQLRELFLAEPGRTAAYFWCTYFVAPSLVVGTRNTYGNQGSIEWLRAFHFRAGCRWAAHEPPILQDAAGRNLAGLWPFRQEETEPRGLVFQHFAYADRSQLAFKESYYGYLGAIEAWERLKAVQTFPVMLRDHFPWVSDGAEVVTAESQAVQPLASLSDDGGWTFRIPAESVEPRDLQAPGLGAVEHILWIRLDAIGDALLAASMLEPLRGAFPGARISVVCQPHVAELYEACPFVDEVLTVDKARALRDPAHLKAVLADIAGLGADLCLHSVYSREPLADAIAGACGALRRIGHFGDDHNRNPEDRPKLDACYTELVPPGEAWDLELERHRDFLGHLGIQAESLRPCVWTTDEDGLEADRLLREAGLEGRSFIVLFAGAQWDMRVYPRYAEALAPILTDHPDLAVLALGTEKERALSQDILDRLPADALNLCGAVSLRVCAALMGRARIGVGAETGLAHMAAAVGLPHAVVLGGGHFGRFMPYSPLTFSAVLPLDCFLCDWRCIHPRHHCVKDLDPAVLGEAVRRALAAGSDLPCVVAQEGWTAASVGPGALDLEPHLDAARARLVKVAGSAFPHAPVLPGPRPERVAAVTFPHRPLPGNTGAKTRFLSQLSMLRDLGYRTHLLGSSFFSDQPWDPGAIQDLYAQYGALTHLHVGSHPDRVWNQVHALRGLPLDLEKQLVPGYLQAFREMVEGHPPDLLVVNYVEWTGLLDLPGLPEGLVTVQENHDLTSINAVLQAGLAETLGGQPFSLATARPEVLALGFPPRPEPSSLPAFREEAAALDRFDLVLAISAVEADLVRAEARHAEVLHLPMSFPAKGADGNTYRGQPVFLASPNFFNIQAYLHMAARLAPTFPKGLEVQVIGGIGPLVSPYPHLNLRGYVEDLTSVYRQAPFAICPLLAGTGQQVKIVEAMAHGIPVVAYEGIARSSPIVHGENGLIAHTPAEFLQHMGQLWKDRALCKRLGGAALETVRTACSYQRGLEAFERALAARFSAMELP